MLSCSKRKLADIPGCDISINIDNQCISRVTSAKFLGVHIDEYLTWSEHICGTTKL